MKISVCKHCGLREDISVKPRGWMANHSRWCDKNPKHKQYKSRGNCWNRGLSKKTDPRMSKVSESLIKAHKDGKYSHVDRRSYGGSRHFSTETRKKMSVSARKSNHRRLQRNIIEYNGIKFDSSWEVRLAKKLDIDNIVWSRPAPLTYTDKLGLQRHYFPDFYLPDFNLYLDPKNPQAFKVQIDKIECLKAQYDNIIFLCSIEEIDSFAPVLALSSKQ